MLQKYRLLNKGRLFLIILISIWTQQNCPCSALTKMETVSGETMSSNFQSPGLIWVVNNCKNRVYSGNLQLLLTCRNGPLKGTGLFLWVQEEMQSSASVEHLQLGLPLGSHLIVFMDAIRVNIMLNYTAIPLLMSSVSWFMVSRHGARTELCSGQGSSIQVPVSAATFHWADRAMLSWE